MPVYTDPNNPSLVDHLKGLLQLAERGEITGVAAVAFLLNGGVTGCKWMALQRDHDRLDSELDKLKRVHDPEPPRSSGA